MMSSILRMRQTVSVANLMALLVTNIGWTTFSSAKSVMVFCGGVHVR
jgi:hypothetical protein